ncbi:MAG TPA: DUF1631 family protein, partial [Casimicrobiaceae bacterium]|nr:DUF1631 family protein [Casimicrobiaceae bacterium]
MQESSFPEPPLLTDAPQDGSFNAADGEALVRACFTQYRTRLYEVAQGSLEMASDLFESNSAVPDGQVAQFRAKRGQWLERFGSTLDELFERRLRGERRKGRRPDADASVASLKVLTAFDQEKQAALVSATNFLRRFTARELSALDLRVETLLERQPKRDTDNPFGVDYLLDAVGATSRAVYPDPRVWRPLMERVLGDLTPATNKIYISLNRYLADHNVLPEIKAALRARSALRPAEDSELLPAFSRMLAQTGDVIPEIVVPESFSPPGTTPGLPFLDELGISGGAAAATPPRQAPANLQRAAPAMTLAPEILAGLTALAKLGTAAAGALPAQTMPAGSMPVQPGAGGSADNLFPALDPLMALGTSSGLFNTLAAWQRLD